MCREALEKLRDYIVKLDSEGVVKATKELVDRGLPAYQVLTEGLSKGLDIVGQKFGNKEYFLSELILAGEIMKAGVAVLEPYLEEGEGGEVLGTILAGTVKGDIHDIGKNIFLTLARIAGFKVIDLGTDVSAEKFVEAAKKHDADIVGISALLSTTKAYMPIVINAFKQFGYRQKVKIIIGGAPITDAYTKKIGADAGTNDAVKGVEICKGMIATRALERGEGDISRDPPLGTSARPSP